jgi:hypothetical protein
VVDRALANLLAWLASDGMPVSEALETAARWGVSRAVSPRESSFLSSDEPVQSEANYFHSRIWSFWTFLWALEVLPELGPPRPTDDQGDVLRQHIPFLLEQGPAQLRSSARLRPQAEILDAADLAYRQFSAVMHLHLKGQPQHPALNAQMVHQRLYTLNWLITDQDWDHVSCDT